MASVTVLDGDAPALPSLDPDELTASIAHARSDLEKAIQVAGLKNDPIAPLLRSVLAALDVQHRLHLAGTRHLRNVSDRLDLQASQSFVHTEKASAAQEAAVVSKLASQLATATDQSIRARLWTVKFRTIAASAGGAAILTLAALGAGYSIGFTSGRTSGFHTANTIAASAERSGPEAAANWAQLITNNDVRSAMTECEKTLTKQGARRACSLPVWLDPPSPPVAVKP